MTSYIGDRVENMQSKIALIKAEMDSFFAFVNQCQPQFNNRDAYHELRARVKYAENLSDALLNIQLEIAGSNVRIMLTGEENILKQYRGSLFSYIARAYTLIERASDPNRV